MSAARAQTGRHHDHRSGRRRERRPGRRHHRLALVVSTAPERGDFARAFALARAACDLDADVSVFFMHHAVAGLPQVRARLAELVDMGCDLAACASSAHSLGLGERDVGMLLGSQDDHAAMVHRAHRVVAFT